MNNKHYFNLCQQVYEEVVKAMGPLNTDQINLVELVVAVTVKVVQKEKEITSIPPKDRSRGYEL